MNKKVLKLIKIFLLIFFLLLLTKIFFRFVYFPNHPTIISGYQQRNDYDSTLDGKKVELLEPPVGGCFDICWGKEELVSCKNYTRKYDSCNFNCYGYVYNNCSSSKLGIIVGLLTK